MEETSFELNSLHSEGDPIEEMDHLTNQVAKMMLSGPPQTITITKKVFDPVHD